MKQEIEWQGRGAVIPSKIKVMRDFGNLKKGSEFEHIFGQSKCAWVPKTALQNDVEVIAETGEDAVLMKQGNFYWWTDMLGMETLDLPAYAAPPYPKIRESEKNLLQAMFDEAKVTYEISPLQVWIVNDIAYSYETDTGFVCIHNDGTVDIPEGMFLSSYERFCDGISLVISGISANKENFVKIRCNPEQIDHVKTNSQIYEFEKVDSRHISIKIPPDNKGKYDIEIYFKK